MKKLTMSACVLAAALGALAQPQRITVQAGGLPPARARRVALVVQNHAPGASIPMMALTDALTAQLSGMGYEVINPYNSLGVNQNRDVRGEKTPPVSALELARGLNADGAITASVIEFLDSTIGSPSLLHQFIVRISLNLTDAQTGATICGETIKMTSPQYTNNQVAQRRQEFLGDLVHAAANECAERLQNNPKVRTWKPTPPPPPLPPPPPPDDPRLTLSDVDGAVQKLGAAMRMSTVFRTNYDEVQKKIERAPLVIVGGLVDLTKGKSPTDDVDNFLGAASQSVRMLLVNSNLFDAKDDALVTTITKRIIENGNSPLEDGELMSALKQHGSPDFYMAGDLRYFDESAARMYRFRLALHNLHTGKIIWEGTETITKKKAVAK